MHLANTLPRSGICNKWRVLYPLLHQLFIILSLTAVFTRSLATSGLQKPMGLLKHWHFVLLARHFLVWLLAAPLWECFFEYIAVLTGEISYLFVLFSSFGLELRYSVGFNITQIKLVNLLFGHLTHDVIVVYHQISARLLCTQVCALFSCVFLSRYRLEALFLRNLGGQKRILPGLISH